eukprot:CAMPEP_0183298208 /NCGR_PEP_ID=MMETSP0160_2-20130417/5301_1 /TAXON_ID=2839 ORGANISM="Odontella Sinensis, Strain Grunow 1884" /NCGR_SAMPLE_ID=MMETSP0160_2 /ASSEMBLY_ACC=CAM_ASM_000250 /LENGTH=199 /DNA_ID=CAMNT_0025460197 /DNA_START=11 /DNA_END=607 /DNA_ORIENTATION=-
MKLSSSVVLFIAAANFSFVFAVSSSDDVILKKLKSSESAPREKATKRHLRRMKGTKKSNKTHSGASKVAQGEGGKKAKVEKVANDGGGKKAKDEKAGGLNKGGGGGTSGGIAGDANDINRTGGSSVINNDCNGSTDHVRLVKKGEYTLDLLRNHPCESDSDCDPCSCCFHFSHYGHWGVRACTNINGYTSATNNFCTSQ